MYFQAGLVTLIACATVPALFPFGVLGTRTPPPGASKTCFVQIHDGEGNSEGFLAFPNTWRSIPYYNTHYRQTLTYALWFNGICEVTKNDGIIPEDHSFKSCWSWERDEHTGLCPEPRPVSPKPKPESPKPKLESPEPKPEAPEPSRGCLSIWTNMIWGSRGNAPECQQHPQSPRGWYIQYKSTFCFPRTQGTWFRD